MVIEKNGLKAWSHVHQPTIQNIVDLLTRRGVTDAEGKRIVEFLEFLPREDDEASIVRWQSPGVIVYRLEIKLSTERAVIRVDFQHMIAGGWHRQIVSTFFSIIEIANDLRITQEVYGWSIQ